MEGGCVEDRKQPQAQVLVFHPETGFPSFCSLEGFFFLISTSHRLPGVLELQFCAAVCVFMWVLRIQTQMRVLAWRGRPQLGVQTGGRTLASYLPLLYLR